MIDKTISPLRQRMIEDMTVRHFNEKVQKDYIRHVKNFTVFLGRSLDTATSEDLRRPAPHRADHHTGNPEVDAQCRQSHADPLSQPGHAPARAGYPFRCATRGELSRERGENLDAWEPGNVRGHVRVAFWAARRSLPRSWMWSAARQRLCSPTTNAARIPSLICGL
jgi:hypothetical protein